MRILVYGDGNSPFHVIYVRALESNIFSYKYWYNIPIHALQHASLYYIQKI